MKNNDNRKTELRNKIATKTAWQSALAKYMVTDIDDILEEVDYVNALRQRSNGASHFGYNLKLYINDRRQYSQTLTGQEQVRDLAQICILLSLFLSYQFGDCENILQVIDGSIAE